MYERFTDSARKVMSLAKQDALRRNAAETDTEHVLLGLLEERDGVAHNVLHGLGIDWESISAAITSRKKPCPPAEMLRASAPPAELPRSFWQAAHSAYQRYLAAQFGPRLPLTTATRRLVEHAMAEARALGHNYVGTEHLLLGMLREPDCTAAQLLTEQGLNLQDVRREVLELLGCA